MPQRYAFPFVGQYVDIQQRQPFLQQQQLQQLQQTNQQVTPTFPITHVQQVKPSTVVVLTPVPGYTGHVSVAIPGWWGLLSGEFPGVSTFCVHCSVALNHNPVICELCTKDPDNIFDGHSGSAAKDCNTHSLHRGTFLGAQSGIVGENMPRQGGFPTAQPTHQAFQGTYPFQQKQGTYDVSHDMQIKKTSNQAADFARQSELVKHVNAKPFEPPKRSTPGSVSSSSAAIGPLVSSTFARNPNLMTICPSPPDLGGSSQSPPVSTSLISSRPLSMSPVDPGIPFPGAVGTFPKHTAMGQFQMQQQPQGVQPQQFTPFQQQPVGIQHALQIRAQGQQQQQGVNQLPGAAAALLPNPAVLAAAMPRQLIRAPGLRPIGMGGTQPSATNAQRFPAPIQRPMTASLMHGLPHMQAPRGPRAQTVPPPQMVPTKQQIVSNRPQMPPQSLPHQDHGQQEQQRVLPMNIQVDQQVKVVTSVPGDKPIVKGQIPRENQKPQEKKEETKSLNIESNPRNRKTNSEQPNKTSKTTKLDSKPEESSKDKNISTKQDGKGPPNKSSSLVRIQPLPIPARNRPNRPRGPPRMPGSMPVNKAKISGRPEKEAKDTVQDQPSESPSPKSSDQAKTSDAQSVPPLSVNKG
ncbi:hypothetical protein OS493_005940 [Desmophyllum pertusum]|uniref:Uncharacterized protein n=1 Tax=Desmophyllum pertusum TaxID=174260 RepID=A0A9W9YFK8_9CNID|nr:hypothetical protein OS493_005940 [Desmophyllum pertusum]